MVPNNRIHIIESCKITLQEKREIMTLLSVKKDKR